MVLHSNPEDSSQITKLVSSLARVDKTRMMNCKLQKMRPRATAVVVVGGKSERAGAESTFKPGGGDWRKEGG